MQDVHRKKSGAGTGPGAAAFCSANGTGVHARRCETDAPIPDQRACTLIAIALWKVETPHRDVSHHVLDKHVGTNSGAGSLPSTV